MAHAPKYMAIGAGLILVEELMRAAFECIRDPRSDAYKRGARELLKCRALGIALRCPYPMGTAENDAFYAGSSEGSVIWQRHLEASVKAAATAGQEVY
jgi:hypothetical protein